ncbi:peptide MFS transporter [Francisella adeliensis]|uniref:Peptide MFS transporter n=1 Tax=Francisella adeliensis TaxID=2007306 RepID=A0A2Z4Y019_9GAMM|nr:peptide MFS transporter [Francisella adeliensis]AXA34092.1 hypothetical protein CDH04_06580 [Francisella adeliensis]MBK2085259.1 peptide MFS transporter [Francisella adeliensis]MBK2095973.1 peptide MFS transporter [Francisella adeliensis]QIW12333.1 peptide MFS transporter [Francisella adeliensis]QIW14207.1 peptide MFS transporter [Francisella adeliensis]
MLNYLKKHPKGLWILCGIEIWERFSYYGMRAILILYLTSEFYGMSDTKAYLTYGSYVAFVYMAPLIGGYVSDVYLGHTRSVKYGCITILIGHLLLSLDVSFFLGLGFVVVGTGFFKSAMNVNIGELYQGKEELKDSGYTLFYMCVNLGGALATLSVPLIALYLGWHAGFITAAGGMALGLLILTIGQHKNLVPQDHIDPTSKTKLITLVLTICAGVVFAYLINNASNTAYILYSLSILALGYLAYRGYKGGQVYIKSISAVVIISIVIMFFWVLFEQTATSLVLFNKRFVDLHLFGMKISAANINVINNISIVCLSPLFAFIWNKWNISVFTKMGLGIIITGSAMGVFGFAAFTAMHGSLAPLLFIVLGIVLVTVGELCCSPTGLAAISKIAPTDIAALLFGVWGIKSGISNFLAGYVATFTDKKSVTSDLVIQAKAFFDVYLYLAVSAIIIGLIVISLSKAFNKAFNI